MAAASSCSASLTAISRAESGAAAWYQEASYFAIGNSLVTTACAMLLTSNPIRPHPRIDGSRQSSAASHTATAYGGCAMQRCTPGQAAQ